jgi:HSP20 family protein
MAGVPATNSQETTMYLTFNRVGRVQPRLNGAAAFDRLFGEIFADSATPTVTSLAARFDVVEKTDRFEARIEIPGVSKDDIDVQIDGAVVRVKAETKAEAKTDDKAEDGTKVLASNRTVRSWARNFTLPAEVDEARAEAAYENGVLTLTLPKKEVAQPKKLAIR